MGYRVGWPLWRLAARAGAPIEFRVQVHFDEESKTFWSDSPDVDGLVAAGDTIPELRAATLDMARDLLGLGTNTIMKQAGIAHRF